MSEGDEFGLDDEEGIEDGMVGRGKEMENEMGRALQSNTSLQSNHFRIRPCRHVSEPL